MKHIPNCISIGRIILAFLLLFTLGQPVLFAIFYLLCGVSDILDGLIARRFHLQSNLGSKLDSLADFLFWTIVFVLLLLHKLYLFSFQILLAIGSVLLIRTINFMITKVKFHRWGMLHTLLNKLAGFLLYFIVMLLFTVNATPPWAVIILFLVCTFSALEETVILLTGNTYEPDKKSYFSKT